MRRDESEFLSGQNYLVERRATKMAPCNDASFFGRMIKEDVTENGTIKPYRLGESVKAKPGSRLHRFLGDYYQHPDITLKIESISALDSDKNHDYLVMPKTSVKGSWVTSQPLPVSHDDLVMERTLQKTGLITDLHRVRPGKYFRFIDRPNGIRADDQYSVQTRFWRKRTCRRR